MYLLADLDICGVTGSGKTTTVLKILRQVSNYCWVNWLSQNSTDTLLYSKIEQKLE